MSAVIIALPTAVLSPVVQPSRRGRLPKSIKNLQTVRVERALQRARLARENQERVVALTQRLHISASLGHLLGLAVVVKSKEGPDIGSAAGEFVDDLPYLRSALHSYAELVETPAAERGQL